MMGYPYWLIGLVEENPNGEMLCVEQIERPETQRDCYAYGRWVRFSSIPCDTIREMFQKCEIVPVCETTYGCFTNEWTCYYSANRARARGEGAIMRCIETIHSFKQTIVFCMVKICVNHHTPIDPHNLYDAVFYYKNDCGYFLPIISIGYDDTLEDGEVSVLRVRSDYSGDIFPQDPYITTDILSKGTYEEVVEGWDKCEDQEELTTYAFRELGNDFTRSWETTVRVADFIYSKAAGDVNHYLIQAASLNLNWCNKDSPQALANKLKAMEWALGHGADINKLLYGSYLSQAIEDKTKIGEIADDETEKALFLEWNDRKIALLKAHGALMPEEIRKQVQTRVESLTLSEIVAL